jgi:FkbM family methyltransferase
MYEKKSHSFEGEDLLIEKIISDKIKITNGFYVDVGAHHPFAMSNTSLLYQKGWTGINIDASPDAMNAFREMRPRDTNINCGVANRIGEFPFSIFKESFLNGFLSEQTRNYHIQRGCVFLREVSIPVRPLRDILRDSIRGNTIDFMNIDVEGLDLGVIISNDWTIYRPKLLCVEIIPATDLQSVIKHPIVRQLEALHFALFSRLHFSCLFIDEAFL